MTITKNITMDLLNRGLTPRIDAVQGESCTRAVCIALTNGGVEWVIPEGASAVVRFRTAARTGGVYDTLPSGGPAYTINGSKLTVTLVPQMLSVPGITEFQIALQMGEKELATFKLCAFVEADPSVGVIRPESYVNAQKWLLDKVRAEIDTLIASGELVGPPGPEGPQGIPGVGVVGARLSDRGQLIYTFADGTEQAMGYATAYGIACDQGFDGTQAEWIASQSGDNALYYQGLDFMLTDLNNGTTVCTVPKEAAYYKLFTAPNGRLTVQLLKDSEEGVPININRDLDIVLAGHSLVFTTVEAGLAFGEGTVCTINSEVAGSALVKAVDGGSSAILEAKGKNLTLKGVGAPRADTDGVVGCLYMDTLTGALYKCVAADGGKFTWDLAEGATDEKIVEAVALMSEAIAADVNAARAEAAAAKAAAGQAAPKEKFIRTEDVSHLYVKGRITTNGAIGTVVDYTVTQGGWWHCILDCEADDVFYITGSSGDAPRLWCLVDENDVIYAQAQASVAQLVNPVVVTATKKGRIIVNGANAYVRSLVRQYSTDVNTIYDDFNSWKYKNFVAPSMPSIYESVSVLPYDLTAVPSYDEIIAGYDALVANYPNYVTKTELGKDASGTYPVYRYDFTPVVPTMERNYVPEGYTYVSKDFPVIIMDACIHGAEKPCALAMLNLMSLIANAKSNNIFGWLKNNVHFVVVPVANPYGYVQFIRSNVNNVDLNRNFSVDWENGDDTTANGRYRGTSPLSEAETQYLDAILKAYKNKAIAYYSWHTHGVFTAYKQMTAFAIGANTKWYKELQTIGLDVINAVTMSGWENHNLPEDSGQIGIMQVLDDFGTTASQGGMYGIPSVCPEVMHRIYDGQTGQQYNNNTNCLNVEYMLYAVADACKVFLYETSAMR